MGGSLSFDQWKELLRNDCIARDKLRAFNSLGELILKVLYDNALDPTVESIVKNGLNGPTEITRNPY
jgi:hypothetical protein